jgi:hypothetical protein
MSYLHIYRLISLICSKDNHIGLSQFGGNVNASARDIYKYMVDIF